MFLAKKQLIENIDSVIGPIRDKRHYYEEHESEVLDILMAGTKKAQKLLQKH